MEPKYDVDAIPRQHAETAERIARGQRVRFSRGDWQAAKEIALIVACIVAVMLIAAFMAGCSKPKPISEKMADNTKQYAEAAAKVDPTYMTDSKTFWSDHWFPAYPSSMSPVELPLVIDPKTGVEMKGNWTYHPPYWEFKPTHKKNRAVNP
jgi:hypothetical protein